MANLRLTNLLSLKNYLADIASQHVSILGFKWGEITVIKNDNRSDISENFLWGMPYENARYSDLFSDNTVKNKVARICYLEKKNSTKFSEMDAQFDDCEAIIEDIISRILRDKKGEAVGSAWQMIATSINSFKTSPVTHTIGSTVYIGWDLEISFQDNTNLSFNPEKWKDTLTPP